MTQLLRRGALVARAQEVAQLDALLADAARGRGSVVLLTGEPGVGKSRLLIEQAQRADATGAAVLVGRAVEGSGSFRPLADALLAHQRRGPLPPPSTLGPFATALARLVPGWVVDQEREDARLDLPLLVSEGLLRLLRLLDDGGGVLLALDDLHWADPDTLTVLDRLADAVAEAPVLLLLAAREGRQPALERLRAAGRARGMALTRLPPADAAALAVSCAGDRALPRHTLRHVVDSAEGLPFLIEELLRALIDSGALVPTPTGWEAAEQVRPSVPASFSSVVHERLNRLDDDARRLVEHAAVLGRTVDWHLLVSLTEQSEASVLAGLRAAVDVGLLVHDPAEPDELRFVHALTREAVRERLLPRQRVVLARSAAPVVERSGHRVLAAGLHAEAGDAARAARLLREAADAEGAALATREALLRRAAELTPDDVEIGTALVEVLSLAGRATEARELGNPLLDRTARDDPRRARLALILSRACLVETQPERAQAYLEQAGRGPGVRVLGAEVAFMEGRPDEAAELARSAAGTSDLPVRFEALVILGRIARLRDRPQEAQAHFDSALSLAEEHGLPLHRVRALAELGTLDMLGPARHDRLEQARLLALQSGQLWTAAMLQRQVTACHALRMEHDETLATAERGRELAQSLRLPVMVGGFLAFTAMAEGYLGRFEEMHAALDEAEPRLRDDVDQLAGVYYMRFLPALVEHDLETVLVGFEKGSRLLRTHASAAPAPWRGIHALVATAVDDGGFEREDLRRSGATVQACNRGALAYAEAVAAGRAGQDPSPHLQVAEQVMEPLTWRRHHCRLLAAPAAVQDGWGSPQEWLREATAFFEQAGNATLARACREQLRRAGAPVPRRSGDTSVPADLRRIGVTSREYEVLGLVGQGLTSSAIAQRLFLSPRTVETHVARLLAKTGASHRGELRTYVPVDP